MQCTIFVVEGCTDRLHIVEVISRLLTWCRYFEHQHSQGETTANTERLLEEALIRLGVVILVYLARLVEIFRQRKTGKADILPSPLTAAPAS